MYVYIALCNVCLHVVRTKVCPSLHCKVPRFEILPVVHLSINCNNSLGQLNVDLIIRALAPTCRARHPPRNLNYM